MMVESAKPGFWYWAAAVALLLWALGGGSIYVAYFVETPGQFASTAETAENQEEYAQYIAAIPWWAIGAGIVAATSRLLGAVALFFRRAWALPLYVISLAAFLVALYRAFVLANVAEVMSPQHIAVEAVFLALSAFAIWFAFDNKAKGVLR